MILISPFVAMQMILTWIRIFNVTNEYFDILYFIIKNYYLICDICIDQLF